MSSKTNAKFKIAIVGCGKISEMSHIPAAVKSNKIELCAIIDNDVERSESFAKKKSLQVSIKKSLSELDAGVDGIVIATPNHTHCPIALVAIQRGIHCLIEKPFGTSVDECQQVLDAAKKKNVKIAVGYCTRFYSNYRLMEKLLRKNFFGELKSFTYQFGSCGGWNAYSAYNFDKKKSGGGVLVVTGSHFIDRMLAWFGYPYDIEFYDDAENGVEANCTGIFHFRKEKPFKGIVKLSKSVVLPKEFTMDFDRGTVSLDESPNSEIIFKTHEHPNLQHITRLEKSVNQDAFLVQLENFADSCRGLDNLVVDGEQGLLSVKLIDMIYQNKHYFETDYYMKYRTP